MKTILFLYFSFVITFCSFAQRNDNGNMNEVDLSDFGTDSLYNEQLKLKEKQGELSDCEFGKKIANDEFNKQNYIYYSKELVGSCLYCDILRHDYNVKWRFSNDLFSIEFYKCFNKEMSELLNKKYGFDIFESASQKINKIHDAKQISIFYEDNKCIPTLIVNQRSEKIYIRDSCIEDTLKIRYRVEVTIEHSLIDTIMPIIIQSVKLIDMDIYSVNPPYIINFLSELTPIESPWQQYIWDLCSAKLLYWYKHQPYDKLPQGEKKRYGNKVYMTAMLYLVPET